MLENLAADGVNVSTVGADRQALHPLDAIHTVHPILVHLDEDQRSRHEVTLEHGDRIVTLGGNVDAGTIGADRDGFGFCEARDCADAVGVYFEQGQRPCYSVTAEHGE